MNTILVCVWLAIPAWLLQVSPTSLAAERLPPWVPEQAVQAARQGYLMMLREETPQSMHAMYGISDSAVALRCELKHPFKWIHVRYSEYEKGHDFREYIRPAFGSQAFGFGIYCGGKLTGEVHVAFKDGKWTMEDVGGFGPNRSSHLDSIFAAYPVSGGFIICEDTWGMYFVFKGEQPFKALEWNSEQKRRIPVAPSDYMGRRKAKLMKEQQSETK